MGPAHTRLPPTSQNTSRHRKQLLTVQRAVLCPALPSRKQLASAFPGAHTQYWVHPFPPLSTSEHFISDKEHHTNHFSASPGDTRWGCTPPYPPRDPWMVPQCPRPRPPRVGAVSSPHFPRVRCHLPGSQYVHPHQGPSGKPQRSGLARPSRFVFLPAGFFSGSWVGRGASRQSTARLP